MTTPVVEVRSDALRDDPSLVIHAGAHKTGSTSLQHVARDNVALLGDQGILALPRAIPFTDEEPNHQLSYARNLQKPIALLSRPRLSNEARQNAKEQLETCLTRLPTYAPTIYISDESILGRKLDPARTLYPSALRRLRVLNSTFEGRTIKIILYIRRQNDYLESCYLQSLNVGSGTSLSDFLKRVELDNLYWLEFADRLASEIGSENLAVRDFDRINEGFVHFAEDHFSLFAEISDLEITDVTANPSLSALGANIARLVGPRVSRKTWHLTRPILQERFIKRPGKPTALLPPSIHQRLARRYGGDVEATVLKYPGW